MGQHQISKSTQYRGHLSISWHIINDQQIGFVTLGPLRHA